MVLVRFSFSKFEVSSVIKHPLENKIMRYAFSGGRVTAKEQREKGADLEEREYNIYIYIYIILYI